MKYLGAASMLLLFLAFAIALLVLVLPIPHYQPGVGWYPGSSIVQNISGKKDPGLSADKLYRAYFTEKARSPLDLECQTDLDCTTYEVLSQCRVYCGNTDASNQDSLDKLDKNRVCDPAGWTPATLNCRCVLGSCINLQ